MNKRLSTALLALLLTGCAARMEKAAVEQASRDFKCASEEIKTEKLAFARYRETGCGKQADYQMVGNCYFDWTVCEAGRLGEISER